MARNITVNKLLQREKRFNLIAVDYGVGLKIWLNLIATKRIIVCSLLIITLSGAQSLFTGLRGVDSQMATNAPLMQNSNISSQTSHCVCRGEHLTRCPFRATLIWQSNIKLWYKLLFIVRLIFGSNIFGNTKNIGSYCVSFLRQFFGQIFSNRNLLLIMSIIN